MKILYLITKGERGGAQSHLWELMRLQRFGMPLLAVGEDGFLADQARAEDMPVHVLSRLVHPIRPWLDLLALRQIIALIRREKPGLLHAHTAKAGMLARIAGFLTGTPTIYTVHAWSFTAPGSSFSRMLSLWLERALSLLNQTVIDVSESNFKMAEKQAVATPGNHLVIWNGVPDTPHRARLSKKDCPVGISPVNVIMVARFAPPKDQCLLLEALAQLPLTEPPAWQCSFVGSGPDQAQAESKTRSLGIDAQVTFLGDRDDVPELLANSDLFVLCSKSESLPISILEAMRAGLPVVASAVGGCAELVTDGVTGLLTKPGDVVDLRNCLQKLLSSQSLREAFGRAGRARFEADFGIEGMIRQTVAAYSKLQPQPFSAVAVRS